MAGREQEIAAKRERLDALRRERGLDAILLARNENIAWATGGARAHIVLSQETGVGALLFDGQGYSLLTNNIEEGRLLAEELGSGPWRSVALPWYSDWLADALHQAGPERLGADVPLAGAVDCAAAIAELRGPLLPEEVERYRALGQETGAALEAAARAVRRGDSEYTIVARIARNLIERGVDPVVLLAAVDDRIRTVRHPLPTGATIDERAMVVCCGRRGGLIANATRLVHLGPVPAALRERHAACARVEVACLAATKPGATAGEIFAAGAAAYAAEGFPGEWQHHHQGGATGYATRDWFGTPDGTAVVKPPQAFAWNPSIAGTKIEDTVLLTEQGLEVITATGAWPTLTVQADGVTYERPDILAL
jgi:antitoxin VapB